MSYKLQLTLIGILVVGLTVGLALGVLGPRFQRPRESTSSITIEQEYSYFSLTREEMIDQAGVIFLGKVVNISSTQWNQDSGEPWYDEATGAGLQLHSIEFEVLQPIVDTVGLDKKVTITALGISPLDNQANKEGNEVMTQGGPDHNLKVGDEAVIFAVKTDLAWRDGTRPILELIGDPMDAHFIRGDDGLYHGRPNEKPVSLKELITQIAQRRQTLVQP